MNLSISDADFVDLADAASVDFAFVAVLRVVVFFAAGFFVVARRVVGFVVAFAISEPPQYLVMSGWPTVCWEPASGTMGKRRCFHGEGRQVFRLQRVDIGLAAGARHHLAFDGKAMEEVVDALGCSIRIETCPQLRILSGNANRAATGVAVVTIAGLDAHLLLEIGLGDVLVAVERHQ